MRMNYEDRVKAWRVQRAAAVKIADTLPVKTLTLEQASALLTPHPEWSNSRPSK